MKQWLDKTFFLTEEDIAEGYEVARGDYGWVAICISVAVFGVLVALRWWFMFN